MILLYLLVISMVIGYPKGKDFAIIRGCEFHFHILFVLAGLVSLRILLMLDNQRWSELGGGRKKNIYFIKISSFHDIWYMFVDFRSPLASFFSTIY